MRGVTRTVAVVLLLAVGLSANLCAAQRIAIVYTDTAKHTMRTVTGLELALRESQPDYDIAKVLLDGADPVQKQAIEAAHADLLVTIGSTATAFADRTFPDLPIVFAKVLNPIESGFIKSWDQPGRHLTGATLDIPAEVQLQKFLTMIPHLKNVGVIFTARTSRLVEDARRAATGMGLKIVSYELTSPKQLPAAIDSLCRTVDGIWTVADEELSTPQFVRFVLLETLRNRIPVMGFNQTFVESGALFCLEADYKYVGRQAAEIALKVLAGGDPAKIKPSVPDIIYLYLNLKSSKLLNLVLPPELVNVAKETY